MRDPLQPASPQGEGYLESALQNPLLRGALVAGLGGLAAVKGKQVSEALKKMGGEQFSKWARVIEQRGSEMDNLWANVGGPQPSKIKPMGGGIDAQAFNVYPGNVVMKLSKPATHLGFDPHKVADEAPRNVLLPVLEHGKVTNPENQRHAFSYFVQPKAKVFSRYEGHGWDLNKPGPRISEKRDKAVERAGQPPIDRISALRALDEELVRQGGDWSIVDRHVGNLGRWQGKDFVIDLGSMQKNQPWAMPPPGAGRNPTLERGPFRDTDVEEALKRWVEARRMGDNLPEDIQRHVMDVRKWAKKQPGGMNKWAQGQWKQPQPPVHGGVMPQDEWARFQIRGNEPNLRPAPPQAAAPENVNAIFEPGYLTPRQLQGHGKQKKGYGPEAVKFARERVKDPNPQRRERAEHIIKYRRRPGA